MEAEAARDPGPGITLMTGGGVAKSRWFWVKSSTRNVADMMMSFSGRSLCETAGSVTLGHAGPGRPLPSWPPSCLRLAAPVLVAKNGRKSRKSGLTARPASPRWWLGKGALKIQSGALGRTVRQGPTQGTVGVARAHLLSPHFPQPPTPPTALHLLPGSPLSLALSVTSS